jgi:hypothetical protein
VTLDWLHLDLKNHVLPVQVRPSAQKQFPSEYEKGMPPR